MSEDWYLDDVFWKNFYLCMFSDSQFEKASEQVDQLLQLTGSEPERVLDLACGPGRFTLPLVRRGYRVTAVDSSPFLLDDLLTRLDGESLQADIVQADMRVFKRSRAFNLALSMWTSFGYFDAPGDDHKVLRNVYESLNDHGRFVIDTVGKEYYLRQLEAVHVRDFDDGSVLFERPEMVQNCSRVENEWTLVRDGKVFKSAFTLTVYSAVELQDRLFDAGFTSVAIYGGLDGSEYTCDSDRLVVVAGK